MNYAYVWIESHPVWFLVGISRNSAWLLIDPESVKFLVGISMYDAKELT